MNGFFSEPAKQIPVSTECDVLVAGGGFAGISAALSAARQGAKVLLCEKLYMLGGLATAGLVSIYLPLCDGQGKQVSFSIAEELLRLSVNKGADNVNAHPVPKCWFKEANIAERAKKRYQVQFNPQYFAIAAEQLLISEGVKILYGTSICDVSVKAGSIDYLIIENKSGRSAVKVKSVVDCTGDSDIFKLANANTRLHEKGNVLAAWYYKTENGKYLLKMHGFADIPESFGKADKPIKDARYKGVEAEELSQMTIDSHAAVLTDYLKQGEFSDDRMLATIATTPQVRMTRKIVGEYTLDYTEQHKEFSDSIGMVSDWRKAGPVFEIPFRTLYSKSIKNLITAGRSISVTDDMWDVTRVIPDCAVTGEAAGAAAAMSDDFGSLDVTALQTVLENRGVKLHEKDIDI